MTVHAPNEQLRQAVETSGLTYAALASTVRTIAAEHGETLRTNKSTVEHWIKGVLPAGRTGFYLAQALSRRLGRLLTEEDLGLTPPDRQFDDSIGLSLGDDPIDALLPIWRAELERRRFLTSSAYSAAAALLPLGPLREIAERAHHARLGHTVGMADVAAVRDMLSMFTDMDERHGGQHGRTALITYLRDDVAPLCRARFAGDTVRRQMLSAASRGVHLAGFKAYDAGQQGLAQRYYLQSFSLAAEGGLPGNAAFTLRTMAMQALKRNRPEVCQGLAETGLDWAKSRVDAHTEAEFHAVYAHTLAEGGQTAAALDHVDHAYRLITTPRPDDPPFWALAWGPAAGSVYARVARVFTALHDPHNAADLYGQAADARPDATYARVNALNLAAKARLQLKQGHIEAACSTWGQSLDRMTEVHSTRTRKAVTDMRRDLSPFRTRGVRAAAQLDDRAAAFLAPRT